MNDLPRVFEPTQHQVRVSCYLDRDNRAVRFEVTDDVSGVRFFDFELTQDVFFNVLGSLGHQRGSVLMYHGPIGYKHEHKVEQVTFPEKAAYRPTDGPEVDKALAPFEVDGWHTRRGSGADYRNGHKAISRVRNETTQSNTFAVTFHRYVHPETGEPWTS